MTLPNFLILGAAKSGSTSLTNMLAQHPDIYIPALKESHYLMFRNGVRPVWAGPGDDAMNRHVITDRRRYEDLFSSVTTETAIGEASVMYLASPWMFSEVQELLPNVRLIAVLREPAARAFSAYGHLRRDGREPALTFREGLEKEAERKAAGWEPLWRYRELSHYAESVRHLFDVFGRDAVHLIRHEDLKTAPREVLRGAFRFLGVDEQVRVALRHSNVSGEVRSQFVQRLVDQPSIPRRVARRLLSPSSREQLFDRLLALNVRPLDVPSEVAKLREEFREEVLDLEHLTGLDLAAWLPQGASRPPSVPPESHRPVVSAERP